MKPPFDDLNIPSSDNIDTANTVKVISNVSTHTSRPHHQGFESVYVIFPNDDEMKRLKNQHYMLKRLFNGNVLSPVTWKEGDKILDACTGSAIWLQDIAKEIPEYVSRVGFDIEDRLFPSDEPRHKSSMELHVHSVLSLPDSWTETFTLAHQRLLISGLRRTEWPCALSELYRVTKPGGWVELCEVTDWYSGPTNEKWKVLVAEAYNKVGLFLDCGKQLESMMRDAGFVDICFVQKSTPLGSWGGKEGKMQSENLMGVWRSVKNMIVTTGGYTDYEVEAWLHKVEREYDEGNGEIGWAVCFGRKPDSLE